MNLPRKTFLVKSLTLSTQVLWVQVITPEFTFDCGFLGAFTKLRNRLLASSPTACLSVRMEQLGSLWTDFHEILILGYFSKICRENSSLIKI
jgi:hypothetical protein